MHINIQFFYCVYSYGKLVIVGHLGSQKVGYLASHARSNGVTKRFSSTQKLNLVNKLQMLSFEQRFLAEGASNAVVRGNKSPFTLWRSHRQPIGA